MEGGDAAAKGSKREAMSERMGSLRLGRGEEGEGDCEARWRVVNGWVGQVCQVRVWLGISIKHHLHQMLCRLEAHRL